MHSIIDYTLVRTLSIAVPLAAVLANIAAVIGALVQTRDRRLRRALATMGCCLAAADLSLPAQSICGSCSEHSALIYVLHVAAFFLPAAILETAVACAGGAAHRHLVWPGYAMAGAFALLELKQLVYSGFVVHPWGGVPGPGMLFPAVAVFSLTCVGCGIWRCVRALQSPASPEARLRSIYWLVGVSCALPLGCTELLAQYGWGILPIWSSRSFFVVGMLLYANARQQLLDLDHLVVKIAGAVAVGLVVALPAAGVMTCILHPAVPWIPCVCAGLLTLAIVAVVVAWLGLRSQIEEGLEAALFPARRAAREALLRFTAEIVKLPCRPDMAKQLLVTLTDTLRLAGAALYRQAEGGSECVLAEAEGEIQAPERVRSARLQETAGVLSRARHQAASELTDPLPPGAGWSACVALGTEAAGLGWIVLGPKRSGAAIHDFEANLMAVAASQLAVALQNAAYVSEIEQQRNAIAELKKRAELENITLREAASSASHFKEIIGSSPGLQRALTVVEKAAPSDASILIVGETGTGKELIARAIHQGSPRHHGPLISVNCSAIPRELAESELFGHERGAFTDAVRDQPGKFELADGGTIFLDEIADLPLELQSKLLRVLQDHETQRLGGRKVYQLNLRVVAATNRDLAMEMRSGRFRSDLYYRLATVVVELPPLRERIEDIPMLASCFLDRAAAQHQRTIKGFSSAALNALRAYSWPGNIRELQNVIERAVLLCTSDIIRPEYLSDIASQPPAPLRHVLRDEKRRRIELALQQTGGNQAAAARLLGLTPSNLARLMKSVGARLPTSLQ